MSARHLRIVLLRKRVMIAAVIAFAIAWAVIFAGLQSDVSSGSQTASTQPLFGGDDDEDYDDDDDEDFSPTTVAPSAPDPVVTSSS